MKVVCVDNFDREDVSDKLVCENVNGSYGKVIVEHLNSVFSGEDSPAYYKLVEDDYVLYTFEP